MPPIHQLVMPAVLVGCAGYISYRRSWRDYPALLSWMCVTALFTGLTWGNAPYPLWIIFAALAVWPFVIRECLGHSRIRAPLFIVIPAPVQVVVLAVQAACLAIPFASMTPGLTFIQHANLARSYFLLMCLGVMVAAVIYRLCHPVLERRRDLAYRWGVTAFLLVKAPASTFVKGGLGYRLMPHATFAHVSAASYWCLMAAVIVASVAIAWESHLQRKRAAKTPKGMTRTGVIEMDRSAA